VLATRGRARRDPWPAHGRLNGVDIPLAYLTKDGDQLVADVPPDQANVAPPEFGEDAKDPILGGTYAIRDLTRGMGRRREHLRPTGRYWYTTNARVRSGRGIVGPEITWATPATRDATVGVTRWFEINDHVFAGNGRYALDGGTTGTGWTVSNDFGSGKALVDAIVVQDNHSGSTRYALAAMGDSENVWRFDGASWTQTSGGNAFTARAWAVDADNLYYVNDRNRLWEVDLSTDILSVANHASPTDRIGTYDHKVVRLDINPAGSLLFLKEDDLYTIDSDGRSNRQFQRLAFPPAATNGEALATWGNATYFVYAGRLYRYSPDGGLTQIGPELFTDHGGPVSGYVTAMVGCDFYLLAGLYNPDTGDSYLLEFTGEIVPDEFGRPEPVWHGSICDAIEGARITSLHVSTVGAPANYKMAYIGLSDGRIGSYVLENRPDPSDCDQCRFSTDPGRIYYSRIYFRFGSERKAIIAATGESDNFSSDNYATLSYRTSGDASYSSLDDDFDAGERTKVLFPTSSSCVFLDPLMQLTATASTATPQLSGLAIEWQLRTLPQEVMQIQVPAADGLLKRDGTPYRLTSDDIRDYIDQLAGFSGGVPWIDPDGDSHQVIVQFPRRVTAYTDGSRKAVNALQVRLIEQQPNETRGILANLELYTLEQLDAFLLSQLEEI
jgi:hypothetical protein